jgi:DNA-binding CsgD family transcriptional regulator
VIRGRVWGTVHIARRAQSGPFDHRDAEALARVAGPIAQGIRASLRFDAARRVTGINAPGLVVLDPDDEVELMTQPAHELLASIRSAAPPYANEALATPVVALASFVRASKDRAPEATNVVTVPGTDGWITLHASLPDPDSSGRVAIVVERASGSRSATVRLEAAGATARERESATLLARGLSKAETAETLVLSPHTVQDHVKNLYEKVGVNSRQELVARVFLDEYLPEIVERTPLTSHGRFDRQ